MAISLQKVSEPERKLTKKLRVKLYVRTTLRVRGQMMQTVRVPKAGNDSKPFECAVKSSSRRTASVCSTDLLGGGPEEQSCWWFLLGSPQLCSSQRKRSECDRMLVFNNLLACALSMEVCNWEFHA